MVQSSKESIVPAKVAASAILHPSPLKVLAVFAVVTAATFALAMPVGMGADETGWVISPMWVMRHLLLFAGALTVVALVSSDGLVNGLRDLILGADLNDKVLGRLVLIALVGGFATSAAVDFLLGTEGPTPKINLPIAGAAGFLHVIVERLFFQSMQEGLGGRKNPRAAVIGVLWLQAIYVFTYAAVMNGSSNAMMTWPMIIVVTTALPAALFAASGSIIPGMCWQLGIVAWDLGANIK